MSDSDGTNTWQLTNLEGNSVQANPRWSPDGKLIAFESRPAGLADIHIVNANGGIPSRLTIDQHNDVAPSWSADGRHIYFASDRGGDWQVWKMPAEGGNAVQVTSKGGFEAHESPDGSFLYYNKYGYLTRGLFRVPISGGEEELVLDIAQRESFGSWKVMRNGIYFVDRDYFTHCKIKYFDFGSRRIQELASFEQQASANPGLVVSPDGRFIILSLRDRGTHDIMLVENFLSTD